MLTADDKGYCWQIYLLAELVLSANNACSALSLRCVTVISRSGITVILCRDMGEKKLF
jgi:hypothetical protein